MQGWHLPMNTCDVIVLQRAASPSSVCCCGVLARLPLGLAAAPPGPCRNSSDEGCPSGGQQRKYQALRTGDSSFNKVPGSCLFTLFAFVVASEITALGSCAILLYIQDLYNCLSNSISVFSTHSSKQSQTATFWGICLLGHVHRTNIWYAYF